MINLNAVACQSECANLKMYVENDKQISTGSSNAIKMNKIKEHNN